MFKWPDGATPLYYIEHCSLNNSDVSLLVLHYEPDEAIPRLWLLLANLHGVYSIAFFAPRTPYCEQYYEHGKVTYNESLSWSYCEMEQPYTKNVTFPEYLMKQYTGKPDAGQGWFLLYLFLYSQVIQRKAPLW